jgi:hypothetical protein
LALTGTATQLILLKHGAVFNPGMNRKDKQERGSFLKKRTKKLLLRFVPA